MAISDDIPLCRAIRPTSLSLLRLQLQFPLYSLRLWGVFWCVKFRCWQFISAPVTEVSFDVDDYSPPLLTPSESRSYYGRGISNRRSDSGDPSRWTRTATFVEGAPRTMRCVAVGGFPLPEMRIFVGAADVTRRFVLSHSVTLNGVRGLRSIRYRTERTADNVAFTSRDDGQPIRCVVTVPGLPANHTVVHIDVLRMFMLTVFLTDYFSGPGKADGLVCLSGLRHLI